MKNSHLFTAPERNEINISSCNVSRERARREVNLSKYSWRNEKKLMQRVVIYKQTREHKWITERVIREMQKCQTKLK